MTNSAGSVLITDSEEIAEQVQENLKYRVPRTSTPSV